jgi:hypothetical protein
VHSIPKSRCVKATANQKFRTSLAAGVVGHATAQIGVGRHTREPAVAHPGIVVGDRSVDWALLL